MYRILYLILVFFLLFSGTSFSQKDTVFWFVAPYATPGHGNSPIGFRLFTYNDPASVTISQPANPSFVPINVNIPANSAQTVDLTAFLNTTMNTPANTVLNFGYKISANTDISAYYEIMHQNNPDIFTLKGNNALGTDFMIPHQNVYENGSYSPTPRGGFDIVAIEDNTTITITPKYAMLGHAAGVPFTIVLNKGQTYSCRTLNASAAQNPMGTTVVSDRPIAITINDDSIINVSGSCRDLIGDQIFPINKTGNEYVLVRGFINGGDRIFITAIEDNTDIFVNGIFQTTINSGDIFTYVLNDPNISVFINTSNNVYVLQATGFGCELGMAIIPALTCTGSSEASFTRSTSEFFGLFIIAKAGSEGSFLFNNNPNIITSADFTPVPGSGGQYLAARKELSLAIMPANSNAIIKNPENHFHFGIINGGASSGCRFGFLSDFASFDFQINANQPYFCEGESMVLTTNYIQGAEYYWTGPSGFTANQPFIEINPVNTSHAGFYTVSGYLENCPIIPDTLFIGIYENPNINISPLGPFCVYNNPIPLTGLPPGGTWQGSAVLQNVFYPVIANIGNNYVSYSVTVNGCTSIDSINIQVFESPEISIIPVEPLCQYDNPISIQVTPPGGTWSGSGISNNIFYPELANPGINNLNYSVTVNGCFASQNIDIEIIETPAITIANFGVACRNDNPVTLIAQPPGGTWQGPSVIGNVFDPSQANAGLNPINYSITINGCSAIGNLNMFVIENPEISILPQGPFCKSDPPVILSATPPGGSWSGPGVLGNMFFPANAQEGINSLTYTVTVNSCTSTEIIDITVIENPQITITDIGQICSNSSPVILEAYPPGGIWEGQGVVENSFDPSSVEPGIYTISYSININECFAFETINVTVLESPAVSIIPIETVCQNDLPIPLQAVPQGGTWTGSGISGNMFVPGLAEPGMNIINYSVTINGCTDSQDITIEMVENPEISIVPTGPLCQMDNPVALQAYPSGGTWTGNALSENIFHPQNANPGNNSLYYSVTINGCSSVETLIIEVIENPQIIIHESGPFCSNENPVNIEVSPLGGIWQGTGISGNMFYPDQALTGENILTYSVNINGCHSSEITVVSVIETPEIIITPISALCKEDAPVQLHAVPPGGIWTSPAVTGDLFYPELAQEGVNTVTYSITINDCSNTESIDITVIDNPQIIISQPDPLCSNDDPITLEATPAGGIWEGQGVTENVFNPGQAGLGQNTITYILTINSCSAFDHIEITVIESPEININPIEQVCKNDSPVLLQADPPGGTWAGPGVSGNMFYPQIAQEGINTVNYSITINGCFGSEDADIAVIDNPEIIIAAFESICQNDAPIVLEAFPTGGVWTGSGVVNENVFDPYLAFPGQNTLTYYVTVNGCSSSDSAAIEVIQNPQITINPVDPLCKNDSPVTLSVLPAGGSWTGSPAVTGNVFNPMQANTGINTIYYTVTINSCSSSESINITVTDNPEVLITDFGPLCSHDSPVFPVGLPSGGVWSGPGITNGVFNPMLADTGNNNLIYEVTINGCSGKDSIVVEVIPTPLIDLPSYGPFCENSDEIILSASPEGGQWTGSGVADNIFYPALAEIGENVLDYYVTQNGCANSAQTIISVIELPHITISEIENLCRNDNPVILEALPPGGTWTGNGVSNNYFYPANAATGINNLTYSVTINNCTNSADLQISVIDNPIITINPVNPLCDYDNDIFIVFEPLGGVWTGPGIIDIHNGLFSPQSANAGNNLIIYNVSQNGCSSTDTISISVIETPQISIIQPELICENDEAFSIIAHPSGGTWSGPGISGNQFNPALANIGDNIIIYQVWEGSCQNTDSIIVVISELPIVEIDEVDPLCRNDEPIILGPGSNFPGIWSGTGIIDYSGGVFDPAIASTGQNIVYFTVSNGACLVQESIVIYLTENADASIHPVEPVCYDNIIINLKANSPGGYWSGYGVTDNGKFHVNVAGIGEHIIYYEIPGKCGDSDSITIKVMPNDILAEYSVKNMLCYDSKDGCITFAIYGGTPPYSVFINDTEQYGGEIIENLEEGTYTVTITDSNSCEYIMKDIPVKVLFNSGCITIPNAFTPNSDGINDTWIIENIEKYPDAEILVFNKWGQLLYAGKGNGAPWDGKYQGKLLPTGTYFYIINLFQKSTNTDKYSGTVSIVY